MRKPSPAPGVDLGCGLFIGLARGLMLAGFAAGW